MNEERDKPGFRVTDRRGSREAGEVPDAAGVAADPETARDAAASGAVEAVTFSTFVLGLSTQALVHLGEIDDPTTGGRTADFVAAKQVIDILGVLDAKTKGNLEHGEIELLGAVLFDLRMRYVELVHRNIKEEK